MIDLQMDADIAKDYKSNAQKIRVISENWVGTNVFCPCCGNSNILHFPNNKPVADFYCDACNEEYELKSTKSEILTSVPGGSYKTMILRIQSSNNPNFLFMNYHKNTLKVQNLLMIPKHFFVKNIIEKRKPLTENARRAGWIGCNILLNKIPESGKIYLIKNEHPFSKNEVVQKYRKTLFLSSYKTDMRGWLLDVLHCIERINISEFSLKMVYAFVDELQLQHPDNHHVKDKIRQQLQILRDNGIIEFMGKGFYKKLF